VTESIIFPNNNTGNNTTRLKADFDIKLHNTVSAYEGFDFEEKSMR
jgi:hypothetical protein